MNYRCNTDVIVDLHMKTMVADGEHLTLVARAMRGLYGTQL